MKLSNGAKKIYGLLKRANEDFSIEKSFPSLNSVKGKALKFDFCIYEKNTKNIKYLIEFDGEGHFNKVGKFYKTNKSFDNAKGRDRIKNNYCLAKNIKLYRIPYWEIDNIKNIEDIFQKKFLVKSQYHNDRLMSK